MPILVLLVGIMLIAAGINDRLPDLAALVKEDFSPTDENVSGFHIWIVAFFVVGSIGYISGLKPIANAFLVLIVITLILRNGAFFEKFSNTIEGI